MAASNRLRSSTGAARRIVVFSAVLLIGVE
jgi:hypothetical protein